LGGWRRDVKEPRAVGIDKLAASVKDHEQPNARINPTRAISIQDYGKG
jgi:hypothetical protein